jgi:hypothetical protein
MAQTERKVKGRRSLKVIEIEFKHLGSKESVQAKSERDLKK